MMLLTPPAVPAARWNAASERALDRTVLDEITRRRIETARRLLVETDLDIGGVAKRSGFSDAGDGRGLPRAFGTHRSDFRKEARPA